VKDLVAAVKDLVAQLRKTVNAAVEEDLVSERIVSAIV